MNLLRNPMTWGAIALALLTAVAVTAGMLYVSPPGQKTITFYTDDAAAVRPGDQVRVAGIPVGEVKDVSLRTDDVQIQARIDDEVFIGDKTTIEVRMLTVVGGYYVDLIPLGDAPLGARSIPRERVTMPYSLIRTLSDVTKITDTIAAKPISESLNEIQNGLRGDNVDALNAIVTAGNTMMSAIDKQRGQITAILNLSDEYINQLSEYREEFKALIQKIAIIQSILEIYSKGFGGALNGLGVAIEALKPIGNFYANHRSEFIEKVRNLLTKGRLWVDRNGVIIRGLQDVQRHIERILDVQQAPPELLATDLCIPMPDAPC
ncbi:virulence factor Mce-like protein [Mycobacterium sp. OAS707]|uniref:MlaD family protein n=1 Tax=Mycobacterium sp. OAS707 TaxID=2663822 RepID=UPI00178BFC4C|nr:MlaD family protein [Mycobacterium sp. OAS707]MBE1549584.1 virulence factor Mce-like protein [Mycobacterium sp. OAS707]